MPGSSLQEGLDMEDRTRTKKRSRPKFSMSGKGGHPIFKALRRCKSVDDVKRFLAEYLEHLTKADPRTKGRKSLALERIGREISIALGHYSDETIAMWRKAIGSCFPVGIVFRS